MNPQFYGPDGIARSTFIFSTSAGYRFLTGTCDAQTAYMEIALRGAAWVQDPNLVSFEGGIFTIPNPAAYPQGLRLVPGQNTIEVRSVLTSGTTTAPATVQIKYVPTQTDQALYQPPTGIVVERLDGAVKIVVSTEALGTQNLLGINIYATSQPGGGTEGYTRINPALIQTQDSITTERATVLGNLSIDSYLSNTSPPIAIRVQGSQVDQDTQALLQNDFDQSLNYEASPGDQHIRYNFSVESVQNVGHFQYIHDRYGDMASRYPTIPSSTLASVAQNQPVYYAVTAVYWNPDTLQETETALSLDASGVPMQITPAIGSFPTVTRQQVTQDLIGLIHEAQPDVAVQPGSVLRDTFIDPMASESERLGFILDFIHKAQSFTTLLSIDDPNLTGASVAVRQSTYKLALAQAFRLTNLNQVQAIIDLSFEKLASNQGKVREPGKQSRGEVSFYVKQPLNTTINMPVGTVVYAGSVEFTTLINASFDANNMAAYYDPTTGYYSTNAFVQAVNQGIQGNVPKKAINRTNISGILVTNTADTFGGTPQESNYNLAMRCIGGLTSDTGTYQGYKNSAFAIPGVLSSQIISAGSPYMLRDIDSQGKHTGGKVDCWVRGQQPTTYQDTFAFSYENVIGATFEVVGNAQDLILRVVSLNPDGTSRVTPATPLSQILSTGIRNLSRGYTFSLTGIQYLSFDTIQLASGYNDPTDLAISDVIQGDFRFQTSNRHYFSRQPVDQILQVTDQSGATINPNLYDLYKLESPFLLGESSMAKDYVQITSDTTLGGVSQATEQHTLIGLYSKRLNRLGVNELTIVVTNTDGTTTYKPVSPFEANPDYRLVAPTGTDTWSIQRTESSTILSGQVVSVTYQYNQNFTVQYSTNLVVGVAQNSLEQSRHLTADVVVKQCNLLPVDITATVLLQAGAVRDVVEPRIRAALQNLVLNSQSLRQSNVVKTIESVQGVSYVLSPLALLRLADGAHILQESLQASQAGDFIVLPQWSTATVSTYLLQDPLNHSTSNGGGPTNLYRAVTRSGVDLKLLTQTPNLTGQPLSTSVDSAFIIGKEGLAIQGYSDDTTLRPQVVGYPQWLALDQKVQAGTATLQEKQSYLYYTAEVANNVQSLRQSLTGNRVLVSCSNDAKPSAYTWVVTYFVNQETGAQDIETGLFDTLTTNLITLTYDQDPQVRRGV